MVVNVRICPVIASVHAVYSNIMMQATTAQSRSLKCELEPVLHVQWYSMYSAPCTVLHVQYSMYRLMHAIQINACKQSASVPCNILACVHQITAHMETSSRDVSF